MYGKNCRFVYPQITQIKEIIFELGDVSFQSTGN
jgi:hypothetical protein